MSTANKILGKPKQTQPLQKYPTVYYNQTLNKHFYNSNAHKTIWY